MEENQMSYNKAISASDPQAVEKLTAKLEACRKQQEYMKSINAYFRKNGTCQGYPNMSESKTAELDIRVQNAYSWEKQPYPSYALSNNNAEIKRLEKRIAEVTRNQEVGFSGWEFAGGHAEANTGIDRLQLFFGERTSKETHSALRHAGFVFSHTNGAYQRQLNSNAIYAAGRLDFLKPTDGRTVREHQPHAPKRDDKVR
jgi:hypothetical protein